MMYWEEQMADQGEGTLMPDKPIQNDGATKKVQEM